MVVSTVPGEAAVDPGGVSLSWRVAALLALARAVGRQVAWGQRLSSREIAGWRARATSIADEQLRGYALASLREKRDLACGAAFFWTLPARRRTALLRLLVAYQTLWDFLDTVSEGIACDGDASARQMHLALVEALTPGAPVSDYYRMHPGADDGGYLRALVEACQLECSRLPAYSRVQAHVLAGVARCSVQAINHDRVPARRELALRRWAARELPSERSMSWFETTAAASAFMPHVLLALASEPDCTDEDVARAHAAYFPWMSLAIVMLDSFVDRVDDLARGDHNYFAYYRDEQVAVTRLIAILRCMKWQLHGLRDGGRHAVLGSCMVAMYISKAPVRAPASRVGTRRIVRECDDAITRLMLPALRAWRICGAVGRC
jgi:tetraprenyl-beta-curcumene synthase